jgi:peroxiredoxin (alkyl hydroperoxide reductase subunit C)
LEVGDEAPDFTLPATGRSAGKGQKGCPITLSSYRGKKNVVLGFFPAAADLSEFERLDAQVLGISVDNVPCNEAWARAIATLHPLDSVQGGPRGRDRLHRLVGRRAEEERSAVQHRW